MDRATAYSLPTKSSTSSEAKRSNNADASWHQIGHHNCLKLSQATGRPRAHTVQAPMSRSPPLQSASSAAESRPQQPPTLLPQPFSASQDAYGRYPSHAGYARAEPTEPMERFQQPYRTTDSFPRPIALPPQSLPSMAQTRPQHAFLPASTSLPSSIYAMTTRSSAPESSAPTSPKSQRKTKGHVASACVPCKRAHLR